MHITKLSIALVGAALAITSCSTSETGQNSAPDDQSTVEAAEGTSAELPTDTVEFLELVDTGDSEAVEATLAEMSESDRAANLESTFESGDTPLMFAAKEGDLDLFDVLAEAGADPNVRDGDSRDILNIAVRTSNPDLADHALDAGTDPTALTTRFMGSTLIFASERGEVEIVEKLIEAGAPIDRANRFGYTALIEATKFGDGSENYQNIVTALLEAGADQSPVDNEGNTALDYATESNHDMIIEILIDAET